VLRGEKKMNAREIENMLRKKHADDIFVAQCKTGPTQTGVQIFDGWALKPSWSNQLAIGYEIKVSRGDYLRDNKWHGYMNYCNEFYFVAPFGLLEKDEIPEGVGLITASGSRLMTKKKAQYHDADPVSIMYLYKYIIMYHSGLIKHGFGEMTREERMAEWEKRIEDKERINRLGWNLSKKLRATIDKEIIDTRNENERLKMEIDNLADVRDALSTLGFSQGNYPRWRAKETIEEKIAEIERGYPASLKVQLESAEMAIRTVKHALGINA
jgi:hypothetical protein